MSIPESWPMFQQTRAGQCPSPKAVAEKRRDPVKVGGKADGVSGKSRCATVGADPICP